MNRCISNHTRRMRFLAPAALAAVFAFGPVVSWAQVVNRPLPSNGTRGVLTVTQPPEVLMDGKADRLSPGARIRGTNNLLVLSGALQGQAVLVHYVREPNGAIHEVWILTQAEANQASPNGR